MSLRLTVEAELTALLVGAAVGGRDDASDDRLRGLREHRALALALLLAIVERHGTAVLTRMVEARGKAVDHAVELAVRAGVVGAVATRIGALRVRLTAEGFEAFSTRMRSRNRVAQGPAVGAAATGSGLRPSRVGRATGAALRSAAGGAA